MPSSPSEKTARNEWMLYTWLNGVRKRKHTTRAKDLLTRLFWYYELAFYIVSFFLHSHFFSLDVLMQRIPFCQSLSLSLFWTHISPLLLSVYSEKEREKRPSVVFLSAEEAYIAASVCLCIILCVYSCLYYTQCLLFVTGCCLYC